MRSSVRTRISSLYACALTCCAPLAVPFSPVGAFGGKASSEAFILSQSRGNLVRSRLYMHSQDQPPAMAQCKILCYGDSLTAGTSPPLGELYPYGPHLERLLNEKISSVVRWKGYPGWTATGMAECLDGPEGLRTLLRFVQSRTGSPADLCIILAGTNDLAYETEAAPIVDALEALHGASHGEGVPTVAMGIPPSAWQRSDPHAGALASEVNASLQRWCQATSGRGEANRRSIFLSCPIDPSTLGGALWSPDGLHLSPDGFRELGEGLAPSLAQILADLKAKV